MFVVILKYIFSRFNIDVLQLPKNDGSVKSTYYNAYYKSVGRSAAYNGIKVINTLNNKVWCGKGVNAYSCALNDKQFIMDFSDYTPLQLNPKDFKVPYFKWHYSIKVLTYPYNVYPLCILQDYDFEEFARVRLQVMYTATGSLITNNQRPVSGAKERRTMVQQMLTAAYKSDVSTTFIPQKTWWMSHDDCLVSVAVPGARNDMLDRGQLELMGLGVCVISPMITTVLMGHRTLISYMHYIAVKPDYSDLIKTINWCQTHREQCQTFGINARNLFDKVATPSVYWEYIKRILDAK